jgi:transposase
MAKTFRAWDVDQRWLLPPSVRDLVEAGHPAHFVRDLVRDDLDLGGILSVYREERGQPPYHPVMMTALLLYGYSRGVYSSRKLATACSERVDFMAVTAMQTPDFRTIADFRKRHLEALGGLFVQVLRLCRRAGLAQLGHVALDGTKVNANASKHKSMSYGRMREEEARLAKEVESWLDQAEATDTAEDAEYGEGRRGDELPKWVANKQKRLEKIREAKAALEREAREQAEAESKAEPSSRRKSKGTPDDKAQRNFTDPESRVLRTKQTYQQAYNCQAAVDADHQVIVAQSVGAQQNDAEELIPIVAQIKANTGRQAEELSADTGYCSEANLKELSRRHIRGFVATGRQRHTQPSATETARMRKGPRTAAMRRRLRQGGWRSRYRLRKQTVEPVFGQIKEARGFRRFLLRGLAKVGHEWSLVCTAHNLRKLALAVG